MKAGKKRKSGAEEVFWDLSDLYISPDDPALETDRIQVLAAADRFVESWKGRVQLLDAVSFLAAIKEYEKIVEGVRKIGSYAHLLWSTATGEPAYGKLLQQSNELSAEVNQKLVFFDVEWLKRDEESARAVIEDEQLSMYRHYLISSRRYREHILEEGQEQVLSAKKVTGRDAWIRFFDELMGRSVYRLDGEELTQQEALSHLHSEDRELRRRAHSSVTETLGVMEKELVFIFNTLLADKHSSDRLRGYDNWLQSRNLANQIEDQSVEALVSSVRSAYPLVQRYYRMKCEMMGLDELFDYDRYAPIAKSDRRITWEEARDLIETAFGKFHPRMKEIATCFFEEKWIDAAIRPGKRGGAYSASTVVSVHPYVFMNFDGRLRDVQTLAHELGHGVHQYLARSQGELQSSTPLTTAETASVFAEMLVFEELMSRFKDPVDQLALLTGKIDDTIATVFRQISMNRFEEAIHLARREGGELTGEEFSRRWIETQQELYSETVTMSDGYKYWWSYIPHFLHTPGYVYAYAFGELLVLSLYRSYREGEPDFAERYLKLLEAGGSDWPHNLVGSMGKDIRKPDFWEEGLYVFEQMVQRAESLNQQLNGKEPQ